MATIIKLPDIEKIPSLSTDERVNVLDLLFEPCTQLHTLSITSLHDKTFEHYGALVESIRSQLFELRQSRLQSDEKWLEAILAAHPRLGEKKVESAMSKQEQAGLQGQGQEAEEETRKLRALNENYEAAFPGLRYVIKASYTTQKDSIQAVLRHVIALAIQDAELGIAFRMLATFVNGRPRPVIMADMQRRIDNSDIGQEKEDAINAMCDIALDRAKKLGASVGGDSLTPGAFQPS